MRSKVSTGTPVAPFAGSVAPDATASSGDPVTGTVRAFTSPVVASAASPSGDEESGDDASSASAEDPSVADGASVVDVSLSDPSGRDPSWVVVSDDASEVPRSFGGELEFEQLAPPAATRADRMNPNVILLDRRFIR
jgi:hypothetical protein